MKGLWKLSAVAILGLAMMMVPGASAAPQRGHEGRAFHGEAYARPHFRGGFYAPAWGYGWGYDPFYDPWWGAGYYGYEAPPPTTGELKLKTPVKDASVYIDGGYMGPASKVKDVPLRPGTHSLELLAPDGTPIFQENVGVVLGKTTEIHALSHHNT